MKCLYVILRTAIPLRHLKPSGLGYELRKKLASLRADSPFHLQCLPVFLHLIHPEQPHQIKEHACLCLAALFHNDPVDILLNPDDEQSQENLDQPEAVAASKEAPEPGSSDEDLIAEKPKALQEENAVSSITCRQKAIHDGTILKLLELLRVGPPIKNLNVIPPANAPQDPKQKEVGQRITVQTAAMQALMSLSTDVEAKKQIVREGGVHVLMESLNKCVRDLYTEGGLDKKGQHDNTRMLLMTLKAMANVAEEYRARFAFQQSVASLQRVIYATDQPLVAAAAKQAIKVISWRP